MHASETPPACRDVPVLSLDRRTPSDVNDADLFTLRLRSPGWRAWRPGQFVMIRPCKTTRPDVIWGRPFSISQADEQELRVVFHIAGRGTKTMLELERGELVTVWGPLGNAFAVSRSGPTLLLAGGIGIAPFVGYIQRHPAPETLRLEFGHRLPLECYPFAECLTTESFVAARNHQECNQEDLARFIGALEESIRDASSRDGLVLACGPMPFLRTVQKLSLQYNARTQLSLETRMACGVGACLGCVVKGSSLEHGHKSPPTPESFSYVQTCAKGPVFWADQVDLENA